MSTANSLFCLAPAAIVRYASLLETVRGLRGILDRHADPAWGEFSRALASLDEAFSRTPDVGSLTKLEEIMVTITETFEKRAARGRLRLVRS